MGDAGDQEDGGGSLYSPSTYGTGGSGAAGESHLEVPFLVAAAFFFLAALASTCVLARFPKLGRGELVKMR